MSDDQIGIKFGSTMAKRSAANSTEKLIFISWSGDYGRQLAEGLKDTIFNIPGLIKGWVSSRDIGANLWRQELSENATNADFGIVCLTPGADASPWINFETAYLLGLKKKCYVLLFETKVAKQLPLESVFLRDGTDQSQIISLLKECLGQDLALLVEPWVINKYPLWKNKYDSVIHQIRERNEYLLDSFVDEASAIGFALQKDFQYKNNPCFSELISESIRETIRQVKDSITHDKHRSRQVFSVSASNYPYCLIHLQKKLKARIKAVALVEYVEQFWSLNAGREILATTNPHSARIFVFKDQSQFDRNILILQTHANKHETYKIYAISYDDLAFQFHPFNRDFSVITIPSDSGIGVLAEYDEANLQKTINFTPDSDEIIKRSIIFEKIVHWSTRVYKDSDMEQLKSSIFGQLTHHKRQYVEMSDYISVDEYDEHEEKHAYYVDMMNTMIDLLIARIEDPQKPIRALELGAGTGIFTKRLVERLQNSGHTDIKIVALELDWACFSKLQHNLRAFKQVEVLLKDSRTFDPEGKFDFILSSFADHHIRMKDRYRYYENIKRNLKDDGLFIVGEEFLRPHNLDNQEERNAALHAYHNHIIEIALQNTHFELAELEREALQSGLEEHGDFKVSNEQYESLLQKSSLNFDQPIKIGPLEQDEIGGVYVYRCYFNKNKM